MFTLSAFADEISPDPEQQIAVLKACDIRFIELRSILNTNVLSLTDLQLEEFKSLLEKHEMKLSAIGSPLGKTRIDEPFEDLLPKYQRAVELCYMFGTPNIRIFSFYNAQGATGWTDKARVEVLDRLSYMVEKAGQTNVRLLHENEHNIYGDDPERVRDILSILVGPHFGAICDPGNYEYCGFDPVRGWELTRDRTVHFHIKDWVKGEPQARLPGEGNGKIPEIIADAVKREFDGFATMEPHLLGGGPTGGKTGPELFPTAVAAFKAIVTTAGGQVN